MAGGRRYRPPVFPSHIRELRGAVSVVADRDRTDGSPIYRVSHISGGGDISFLSEPIALQDHADAAARVLAEYFQAQKVEA
jgi:hypothetical protein